MMECVLALYFWDPGTYVKVDGSLFFILLKHIEHYLPDYRIFASFSFGAFWGRFRGMTYSSNYE